MKTVIIFHSDNSYNSESYHGIRDICNALKEIEEENNGKTYLITIEEVTTISK